MKQLKIQQRRGTHRNLHNMHGHILVISSMRWSPRSSSRDHLRNHLWDSLRDEPWPGPLQPRPHPDHTPTTKTLSHRTQIVCICFGHINWTKSHDQLYAPYFIHFGFWCINFRSNNTTDTCSLVIILTSVTNKNTKETKSQTTRPTKNSWPTHDHLFFQIIPPKLDRLHDQPHDYYHDQLFPAETNHTTKYCVVFTR